MDLHYSILPYNSNFAFTRCTTANVRIYRSRNSSVSGGPYESNCVGVSWQDVCSDSSGLSAIWLPKKKCDL